MQESSSNLPPLGASTELISCANGLKFKLIDNVQPKLLPFFGDALLHSRVTDSHQVKDKSVA